MGSRTTHLLADIPNSIEYCAKCAADLPTRFPHCCREAPALRSLSIWLRQSAWQVCPVWTRWTAWLARHVLSGTAPVEAAEGEVPYHEFCIQCCSLLKLSGMTSCMLGTCMPAPVASEAELQCIERRAKH